MTERKTILLVDDDFDLAEQMKFWIEKEGYDVIYAGSEREANEILDEKKFDLALLDLMMENKDSGFVLAYKIKKMDKNIPVIIVTAVTRDTGMEFLLDSKEDKSWIKADEIIQKCIRPEQLTKKKKKYLEV